jgi:hypothetical protein
VKVRQHMKQLAKHTWPLVLSGLMIGGLSAKAEAATISYSDVNTSDWSYTYIMDLSNKGIAQGADGQFFPNANVSRAEFAKLLVSALHMPLSTDKTQDFYDVPTTAWYFPYVKTAFQGNVVHGVGTDANGAQFAPTAPISRQDMLVMLANALHLQPIPPELLDTALVFNDTNQIRDNAQNAVALGKELQLVSGTPSGDFQPTASTSRAQAAVVIDRMLGLTPDRLQVLQDPTFHPTTHLAVHVLPSSNVVTGQQTQVEVSVLDSNDQQVTLDQPMTVNLSALGDPVGTLSDQTLTIPTTGSALTTFQSSMSRTGDLMITAQPPADVLKHTISGSAHLNVFTQNAAKLVSGKGMWMMWGDWHSNNTDNLLSVAKAKGVTHLYIEVATSYNNQGFYGSDALDDLLPKAHKAGIKVIGWTYDSLKTPANDAKVDISVAKYRTPSGDQVDGLAPDIEETANVTTASVTTYSSALRTALGQYYPLILCSYPPDWRPNFPWQTFGKYYDVIAPMDYWHYRSKAYTYNEAFTEVANSIKQIRNLTGKPNIPITIIGQGYDMFTDDKGSNSPTTDEIRGSMDAAKQGGAVGYSLYRWNTVSDVEWGAFGTYKW